jgi:hypothetical protein
MRWFPRRASDRKEVSDRDTDVQDQALRMDEAREAQREGREALERAYEQWPEVSDLAQVLRELRSRNHFSEQVRVMLQRASAPAPKRR